MKTTFERIVKKTKIKPKSCKCSKCKTQCITAPCLGTPEDIWNLIQAGYIDMIKPTIWGAGIAMGVTNQLIEMYQAEFVNNEYCTFFVNGLCSLHNVGLKPTEGKLSYHEPQNMYNPQLNLTWLVAKEWIDVRNQETINKIKSVIDENNQTR